MDVFFVISGFLISRIIISEIEAGRFSFAGFYDRRIRRIVPALLVVLGASLVAGMLVALPDQFVQIGKSAIAAVLSISNIFFWRQSGYFAPAAELMPLLHTWSLGVEEQFYILFPIVLVVLARTRIPLRWVLGLSIVPLFLLGLWLSHTKPSVAFYLLPARAWELGLGAMLAAGAMPTARGRITCETGSAIGLGLILFSLFFIDSQMMFPGWVALLPCVGAGLVIHCASRDTLVGRALSLRPIVFIGLISYSLYLWHWPIFAFSRMYSADIHMPPTQAVFLITLAVLLSGLTWRFVERPFRDRRSMPSRRVVATLGAAATCVTVGAVAVVALGGLPQRLDPEAIRLLAASEDIDPMRVACSYSPGEGLPMSCRFGPVGAPIRYVVLGDSHAGALRPAFEEDFSVSDGAGTLWYRGACPTLLGARTVGMADGAVCTAFKEQALRTLAQSPEIELVILAGRWAYAMTGTAPEVGTAYRVDLADDLTTTISPEETERVFERAIARTVEALTDLGKRVIIVGAVPEPGFDVPRMLALAALNGQRDATHARQLGRRGALEINQRLDDVFMRIASSHPDVAYMPIWDILCPDECMIIDEGVPLYSDDDHLTYNAALHVLGPVIRARMGDAIASTVATALPKDASSD